MLDAIDHDDRAQGFDEKKGASRAKGVQHGAFPNRQTWLERKTQEAAELGVTKQPYCLIIGGGQGGIVLGARLKQLLAFHAM